MAARPRPAPKPHDTTSRPMLELLDMTPPRYQLSNATIRCCGHCLERRSCNGDPTSACGPVRVDLQCALLPATILSWKTTHQAVVQPRRPNCANRFSLAHS